MDKNMKKTLNDKLKLPLIVALIGVLILIVGMFLPYMSAVGRMAEYIEKYPDSVGIKEYDMTAADLKDIPMIYLGRVAASAYSEEEGALFHAFVIVFAVLSVLTALFAILKKPIAVMIFGMITCGAFGILNWAAETDFIDPDKYRWGVGYYAIAIAFAVVLAGAIWMLVRKIAAKKELEIERLMQPEA